MISSHSVPEYQNQRHHIQVCTRRHSSVADETGLKVHSDSAVCNYQEILAEEQDVVIKSNQDIAGGGKLQAWLHERKWRRSF
jgi:NAD dependent epimerase/dehydratase family enzyme